MRILLSIILLFVYGYHNSVIAKNECLSVELFMKSPGYKRAGYLFKVNKNKEYQVIYGRPYENADSVGIDKVYQETSLIVLEKEWRKLSDLIKEVNEHDPINGPLYKDSWNYKLYVNNEKKIDLYHGSLDEQPEYVQDIIEYLIKLSPISIEYDTWQMIDN